jgi:hypothetical protein
VAGTIGPIGGRCLVSQVDVGDAASNIEKMTREFGLVGWTKYGGQPVFLLFVRSPMRYFIASTLAAGRAMEYFIWQKLL